MNLNRRTILNLLAVLGLVALSVTEAFSQKQTTLEAKVDAYVKPFIDIKGFSGTVLVASKGRVVLRKGYGLANYELGIPNTPQTKFHLASVSKSFTAAAIMILVERGSVSVNDPLTKYIPDYPNGDQITIHRLLIHTSGIPNVNSFPDYEEKSKLPQTPATLVEMFKHKPLIMKPGERYSYSNSNYNVLAFIIEKVSGKSYGDFLRENIFDPLGMKDTGHDEKAGMLIDNRADGYAPVGLNDLENAPYLDWTIKTGNGSLYSTVDDLYKWDRALYTEKLLKKDTLKTIFTSYVDGVGYGWFISRRLNRKTIRMSGRSPGFQCEIQRYIDDDACVIVLSNNYSGAASLIITDLAAMVFDEPYEKLAINPNLKVDSKIMASYLGSFQGGDDFFLPKALVEVEKNEGALTMRWPTRTVSWFVPITETSFYDRIFGGVVTFVKSDRGQVSHLNYRLMNTDYRLTRTN